MHACFSNACKDDSNPDQNVQVQSSAQDFHVLTGLSTDLAGPSLHDIYIYIGMDGAMSLLFYRKIFIKPLLDFLCASCSRHKRVSQ